MVISFNNIFENIMTKLYLFVYLHVKMKPFKTLCKKYLNFKFWKKVIHSIINYSPVTILDYLNFCIKTGVFAYSCVMFFDIKIINGVPSLHYNRKATTTVAVLIGKI